MRNAIKYICALLLLVGVNVSAWGTGIYIEYNSTKYYDGSTITINLDYTGDELFDETEMAIKNDAGWTDAQYYGYGYIKASISGTPVKENLYFDNAFGVKTSTQKAYLDEEDNPVSFYEYNSEDQYEYIFFGVIYDFTEAGTYTATLTIWQEELQDPKPTYQSATITLQYVVTAACTARTLSFANASVTKDFGAAAGKYQDCTLSAGSGTVTWSSSDEAVATVNSSGVVTILKAGTTTIGVTVANDGTYCERSASYTLTVNSVIPTVTDFTATPATNSITLTNAQVSNKGGAAITEYGYIYSTTASTAGTLTKGASGVNAATVASTDIAASTNFAEKVLSGLTENTHYYIRAYATNAAGTGYSDVKDVKTVTYTDYVFSCAELTLTGPTGDLIFITSAASKTVRSQEAFHVTGSGLTPSTTLTFAMSDPTTAGKFAFKQADGSAVATNASGAIDMDFYVFYTPASGDTEDGLDRFTNLSASVSGTKPKTSAALTDKTVIGRHLPADFVIAAKRNGKWYAIPSNMTMAESTTPVEIAVDDANNPTIAYTATTNNYSLYDQALSTGVKLAMHGQSDAPLAASPTTTGIGKSSATVVTNNQADNYLWLFAQTNTEVATAAEAKYTMKSLGGYNNYFVRLKENAGNPIWGQYDSGNSELRLIPASDAVFTEAEIVAWGQHNAIVEVDRANAGGTGVAAAKVKALLNGAESSLITLTETGTSKGSSSKYNYTVAFGDVIDFAAAANAGQMLTLEWYNSSDVMIAVSNIIVPTIVASDITINKTNYSLKSAWNTEVHVLPNVTVTVDAIAYDNSDVTIKELNIYPGATVKVTTGTLKATTLVMRNGWDRLNGEKKYDVARLYIDASANLGMPTNAYADWYIDYDQYYPIAVPWKVTTAGITYLNTSNAASSSVIKLRYYDGAGRVTGANGSAAVGANWVELNPWPETLDPSKGYAMTARRPTGKAFSIVRMPLTIPSAAWTTGGEKGSVIVDAVTTHKDQVEVTAHGADDPSKPEYVKGWNFIANPYMALHQGELSYTDAGTIEYANIPDVNFKEYDQVPIATTKLKPASGFLVQAPKTGTVTFGETNRWASAPSYRTKATDETPVQRAYITLANETNEDMMGLLIADKFTEAYEMNADLEKLLSDGNTLRTYMRYGDMNMAYVAINEMLAKEWIPVSVRIPADGEYTFSLHEASIAGELEGVYLIDYQNGDKITNLIEQSYTFSSTAGTINGRFAINAKVGERQTPTGIDAINAGGDINSDKPFKFIYHDKVYIWLNGVIYDTTGKRVK